MREEINRILAKESLEDHDIKILVKGMNLLTQDEKVRLGFIPAPVVKEQVITPEVVAEAPKAKRASSKKK